MKTIKKVTLFSTAFIAATLMMVSCSKEENVTNLTKKNYIADYLPEEIGEMHNNTLWAVGESMINILTMYGEADSIAAEDFEGLLDMTNSQLWGVLESKYPNLTSFEEYGIGRDWINIHDDLIDSASLSSYPGMDIIASILTNYYAYDGIDSLCAATGRAEQAVWDNFIEEPEYMGDTVIEKDTAFTLSVLHTLNVFRHSLSFWNDAVINESNPWHTYIEGPFSENKGKTITSIGSWLKETVTNIKENFKEVALCDAAGAAKGAIFGLPTQNPEIIVGCALTGGAFQSARAAIRGSRNKEKRQ